MGVPEEIRRVKRPKNTIVADTGHDSEKRYVVRERMGGGRKSAGGNYMPRNGKVIGYIHDGEFVPRTERPPKWETEPTLSFGGAAFIQSVSADIAEELKQLFDEDTADSILGIAALRVLDPGIEDQHLERLYLSTYISVYYPDLALTEDDLLELFESLGNEPQKQQEFFGLRLQHVPEEHHIAICSMRKEDRNAIGDLSSMTFRVPEKPDPPASLLCAYDAETSEPLCAKAIPEGTCLDAAAYKAFLDDFNISAGVLVEDQMLSTSDIEPRLEDRPDFHFLIPFDISNMRVRTGKTRDDERILDVGEDTVAYRKYKMRGQYLYSFFSLSERRPFLSDSLEDKSDFAGIPFAWRLYEDGSATFESDLDMPPLTVYRCYEDQWIIRQVFQTFHPFLDSEEADEQPDYVELGSQFIDFIASIITCRLIRKARNAHLLEDRTFSRLMRDLDTAWRKAQASMNPAHNDRGWIRAFDYVQTELEALGLSKPPYKPGRRGRPRKNAAAQNSSGSGSGGTT